MGCIHNWIISEARDSVEEEIAIVGMHGDQGSDRGDKLIGTVSGCIVITKCQVRKRQDQNGCNNIHLWEWKRREVQPWENVLEPGTRRVLCLSTVTTSFLSTSRFPCPWQGHKFLYNGHFFRRSFASKCHRLSFTFIFFRRYAPTPSKPPRFQRETATASGRSRRTPPRTACRARGASQAPPGD